MAQEDVTPPDVESNSLSDANKAGAGYSEVPTEEISDDRKQFEDERGGWLERILLDTWIPETLALAFSIGCLIAILAVLLSFNGRASPRLPYGITLNAVISILATTSRSMLLYVVAASISQLKWCWLKTSRKLQDLQIHDDASRGPWGAMTMLVYLRARPIASIGAIITILALAIDPFVQQVLTYPTRMVESLDAAPSLTRARSFAVDPTSDEWVNAIARGMFSPAEQFDRQPGCPTGNCHWPAFRSVGWCKKCTDVTAQAQLQNCSIGALTDGHIDNSTKPCTVSINGGDKLALVKLLPPFSYGPASEAGRLGMVRPFTIIKDVVWHLGFPATGRGSVEGEVYSQPFATTPSPDPDVVHPVVALGHLSMDFDDTPSYVKIRKVEECALSLCSMDYNVTVRNGTASSIPLGDSSFGRIDMVDTLVATNDNHTDFYRSKVPCWRKTNETVLPRKIGRCNSTAVDADYVCPPGLDELCFASQTYANSLTVHLVGSRTYTYHTGTFADTSSLGYDQDPRPAIQYVGSYGLSSALDGVAASLTQLALSGNDTGTVSGTAMTPETYVHVRLSWLALPFALEVGGAAFLLIAVVHSWRREMKPWKASLLPLLFHGLEQRALSQIATPEPASAMSGVADRVKVRLGYLSAEKKSLLKRM